MITFKVLGLYIIVNNMITLLMEAVISFRILKNISGLTTYVLSLTPRGIMLALGLIFILVARKLEENMQEKVEYKLFQRIMTGLLIMTSSFSASIYLLSRTIGSFISIRSIFSGDEELYGAVINAFYVTGLDLCFLIVEFLIGLGFFLGWFARFEYLLSERNSSSD